MGHGSTYSTNSKGSFDSSIREKKYTDKGMHLGAMSLNQTFKEVQMKETMNPYGVELRECRDSADHPLTKPFIIALDVTGSMGSIPHYLMQNGLPKIMGNIVQKGIKDPQLLFMGIGDHECDESPLQVGQFESTDELMDKWLQDVYLEGGGGANDGESYLLAWHFAGFHTVLDCYKERGEKGVLITIGDEKCLPRIPQKEIKRITGEAGQKDFTADELLEIASETYECYHINVMAGYSGSRTDVVDQWRQLMSDHLVLVDTKEEIADAISTIVINHNLNASSQTVKLTAVETSQEVENTTDEVTFIK